MLYTYEIQKTNSYHILTGIFIDKLLLSNLRRETIANLKKDIANKMIDIGFKSVSFLLQNRFLESEIGIEIENKKIKFAKDGIDDIELLISLNVEESRKVV